MTAASSDGHGDAALVLPKALANEIVDSQVHASQRIHDVCTWLRDNQPLGIAEPDGFDPFWVVTRQRDIREIASRPEDFVNDEKVTLIDRASLVHLRQMLEGRSWPVHTLLQMNAPEHTVYRALTADFFHPRALEALAKQIRVTAREAIDGMIATGGACDFSRDVAFLYPLRVIMMIMGLPPEDERKILHLTQALVGFTDEEFAHESETAGAAFSSAADDFNDYFNGLLADRQREPREDVLSAIANAKINGEPIPLLEARSYCLMLGTAGHETTATTTAAAVHALCLNPDIFAQVKADRSLVPALVEEATRFYPASKMEMRSAARDIEACGRSFKKGDWLALVFGSGSRDEEYIEDPHTFRIDRKANKLLSFGFGPHVCLGQHLARLEMRIMMEEFFERIDAVELTGEPKYLASPIVSGIKSLPIRFRAS